MNLMHCRARVRNGSNLIGIKLLPPIQRCRDIHRHHDLAQEFSVVGSCLCELLCKGEVVLAEEKLIAVLAVGLVAVRFIPAVHRVSHTVDGGHPSVGTQVFDLNQFSVPPLGRHCARYQLVVYILAEFIIGVIVAFWVVLHRII